MQNTWFRILHLCHIQIITLSWQVSTKYLLLYTLYSYYCQCFFFCHTPDGLKLQQYVGVFKGKGRLEGISQRQDIGKNSKWLGLGYFEDLRRFNNLSVILLLGSRRCPISEIQVVRPGIEPRTPCSASQELNHLSTVPLENDNLPGHGRFTNED